MPGFEDDLRKLETVVEKLERGDLTLEDSVKLFEQGIKLSGACKQELDKAEGRIQVLVQGKRGAMQTADLDVEAAEPRFGLASQREDS